MTKLPLLVIAVMTVSPLAGEDAAVFHGSASYGTDATLWWLDDSFSANLVEMETKRDTPIFHEFKLSLSKFFGFDLKANFFLDKLLDPLGLFAPDLSLGFSRSSGGLQTSLSYPLALETTGDISPLKLVVEYKYRLFRWENRIKSIWLDTVADYFDEKGQRTKYSVGSSFSTASKWNNLYAGLSTASLGELPVGLFAGLEWWDLQAPTLISLSIRDSLSAMANLIMQTNNTFIGLRTKMFVGVDPNEPENLPPDLTIGMNFGGTFGWFTASNTYLQAPSEFSFTLFGGLQGGFSFQPWEGAKGFVLVGADSTFSLLDIFGSASPAGTIKKSLTFRDLGTDATYPAGTQVDVSIDRWETWAIPYLKAGLTF